MNSFRQAAPRRPFHGSGGLVNLFSCFLWVGLVLAAGPLYLRVREEKADRRVALAVEWSEYRDFNARLSRSTPQLLAELRAQGVTSLVLNPLTLTDLWRQQRLRPLGNGAPDPLDVGRVRVYDASLARQLFDQLVMQKIPGLQMVPEGKGAVISAPSGTFTALKDTNLGFDPLLIAQSRLAGLTPILRIYDDPWIPEGSLGQWLRHLPTAQPHLGVLFSSDEIPGGPGQRSLWNKWMQNNNVTQFLPEFKPARSAWLMSYAQPFNTFRAHSIPAPELRDLKAAAQKSRWFRAIEERSCRLLLMRMAPNESRESFFRSITGVNLLLKNHAKLNAFPRPRMTWDAPTAFERWGKPFVAFGLICVIPPLALLSALKLLPKWRWAFIRIVLGCLVGALIAAAIAQTPYTRIQVLPFRGVKWAFIISWGLSLFALYDVKDLRWNLYQYVRRSDLILLGLGALGFGYLILRTGNAPAAFRLGGEQLVRDALETILIARPRFKEFAIGYPLLWVGCYLQTLANERRSPWDGRLFIFLGMIGPISMINTFCHLHSPIVLEIWRSINGVVLGSLIGTVMVLAIRRWLSERPQISLPFVEGEALYYQRLS